MASGPCQSAYSCRMYGVAVWLRVFIKVFTYWERAESLLGFGPWSESYLSNTRLVSAGLCDLGLCKSVYLFRARLDFWLASGPCQRVYCVLVENAWVSDWLRILVRVFICSERLWIFIGFWPVLESLIIMLCTHWLSVWPQARDSVCFLRESLVRFQLSPCKSLGRTQHLIILAPYSECFIYRGVFTWVRCVVSEPSRSLAGGHIELVSVGSGLFFTYISWGGFNFLIGLRSLSKPSFVQNELRTWSASGLRQSRIR